MPKFFQNPILNNPYEIPDRFWELDEKNQPTEKIINHRRPAEFITPVPRARQAGQDEQIEMSLSLTKDNNTSENKQEYLMTIINGVREEVYKWRQYTTPSKWGVTPETAKLLEYWRHHEFTHIKPFFCQVEAVETFIWLTEVATKNKSGRDYLKYLEKVNQDANSELNRLALKLATGAGKTMVMAMLIAWQAINAARRPNSKKFTNGFLIVTPGITIRDRLRVLQPNDPDSYYFKNELVPMDFRPELNKAKIVITNFHAFMRRERINLTKVSRTLLQGRGTEIGTKESEGQMIQRVMPELMGMKNILVFNDEAHHCYREKTKDIEEEKLKGDERKEAKENTEAARIWVSGLESVNRVIGIAKVTDLSATPFFLSGSGYREGTLFPWTMSDFSMMDAIECGIIKLPRVPIRDNIPKKEMPTYRNLWKHISKDMPKKGRGSSKKELDPEQLPVRLQSAIEALYGHYEETHKLWDNSGLQIPPCFIFVCNNTATSKLVFEFISGYYRENERGIPYFHQGRYELFRNFDENGNQFAKPNTLLIDSRQLESGEALDKNFRKAASAEIDLFRREKIQRTGDSEAAEKITDQDLLREVMNTVGKKGKLGESLRCVVSVSMLTEGWDANNVTHILGIRAFGTQLLCEQVIGRALRRQSYEINSSTNLFDVEYADVFGIPFDFTAKAVKSSPQLPLETVQVKAISPERDHLEIIFPNVGGYRVELPRENVSAQFNEDSVMELTPEMVGPTKVENRGILGEGTQLSLERLKEARPSEIVYNLTKRLLMTKFRDPNESPKSYLFFQLKNITQEWIDNCLICKGGTYPAQLLYQELADMACGRITLAITRAEVGKRPIKAVIDPYNPIGSTRHVNFVTSKPASDRWETDPNLCHINWAVLHGSWEREFCRIVELHPRVRAYVKNYNLHFKVPYLMGSITKQYIPDFIVRIDDGNGEDDLLNLIVEIKGYRGEDAKVKKETMDVYWIPGVNNNGNYGRWAFAEFRDLYEIEDEFDSVIESNLNSLIDSHAKSHKK